ncbi:MAG: hypothetical protein HFH11_11070 [Dorea sp.]|jgi:hypothetical protein|nr:hypothetical protein [Dorea sp.]
MKIYGDYSFVLDRLNVMYESRIQIAQNGTKIVEFADQFIEEQKAVSEDKVTISREGMEYLREQLSDLGAGVNVGTEGSTSTTQITNKDMSLMDGLCKTYITLRLDSVDETGVSTNIHRDLFSQYWQEMNKKDREDWSDHTQSLTDSYASMYKKIVKGYADGTREVWVEDNSTGEDFSGIELEIDGQAVRYRKLTKEEELAYLDKTFDELVKNQADQFAKEEAARNHKDTEKETDSSDEALAAFEKIVNGLVNEVKTLLERVMKELEDLLNFDGPEIDFEGRMEIEAHNHRIETAARGKQQSQYANYRKISQMASGMQALLGNIRA